MTFAQLAEIVGKPVRTVTQAFHRKGYSIKKPADIQAYLHLVHRPRQVRAQQPWRQTDHLRRHQFKPAHRGGRDVAVWVAAVRRSGKVGRLTADHQAVLAHLAEGVLTDSRACLGVIFAGDFLFGGPDLVIVPIYLSRPSRRLAAERFAYAAGQMGERQGFTPRVIACAIDELPARLAAEPDLVGVLRVGRLEYGWVALPIG